ELAQTEAGVGVIVGVAGKALIGTFDVLEAEQPDEFVTVSVRSAVPLAPAVYVTVCEFVPDVIVPLTIDQRYAVAPAGPAAVLPVVPAQTELFGETETVAPPLPVPVIRGCGPASGPRR